MRALIKKESKHKAHGTGVLPKTLFIGMTFFGAVLIWVMKINNPDPMNLLLDYYDWMLMTIPGLIIVIYCLIAYNTNLFYVREDQIGDNAYYMGFLFTLSSLAYALLSFQLSRNTGNPADIIGSFGVALWSTIVGIALRVFFSQLRHDPHDIEKEARSKIAHTASLLSTDLYQAAATFNAYTRGLQQAVEESFIQTKEAASRTSSSISDFNKKIDEIEAPGTIINKKIDAIFSNLEGTTQRLNSLANAQAQSVEILLSSSNALKDSILGLNEQVTSLKEYDGVVTSGGQSINKIAEVVKTLEKEITKLADGLSALNNQQTQAVKNITSHADALGSQLERSRKYTEETHDSLTSMTKTLAEKLQ